MMTDNMWAGHWFWILMFAIVVVITVWRICQRTGYPGWLGILILIPIANPVLLYFITFSSWTADKMRNQDD
jgi:hypothetical protein